MRRAKWLALRQQVCQAVEALQHEVTCRLPKSRDASGISPAVRSEQSPRGLSELERQRRPLVLLWTCSSMDNLKNLESTGLDMWSKRSESSADHCAQSGTGISSDEACELYQPVFLSAQIVRTPSNLHWLKSSEKESSTVSNHNIHSTHRLS